MRGVLLKSYREKSTFSPTIITAKLQGTPLSTMTHNFFNLMYGIVIAKNMRRGRQEDSHEFLRYAIDALQKSCLAGYPPCGLNTMCSLLFC